MFKKILYKTYTVPFHIRDIFIRGLLIKFKKKWSKRLYKSKCPLKWGFIGTGNMAQRFVNAINESPDNIVYAVLSRSSERARDFSKKFNINSAYNDIHEFLNNKEIDIVYVATPVETHYEYIKACLESSKNVFCEKPLVLTSEEVIALNNLAQEKGCFLMEAMWSRLLPTYRQALKWIDDGLIGDIEAIRVEKAKLKRYIAQKSRKYVMYDYGIYPLSFIQFFLKNIEVEQVVVASSVNGYDADWHIILKEGNKKAIVDISGRYHSESKAYIIGTKGTIEFQGHFNRTNTVSLYSLNGNLVQRKTFNYTSEGFEYEVDEVNRLIRTGMKQSDIVSLEDTQKVIGLMENALSHIKA